VQVSGERPVGVIQALRDQQGVACNSTAEFWKKSSKLNYELIDICGD